MQGGLYSTQKLSQPSEYPINGFQHVVRRRQGLTHLLGGLGIVVLLLVCVYMATGAPKQSSTRINPLQEAPSAKVLAQDNSLQPDVDCSNFYHLPANPKIFGHYAGTHCPCLENGLVPSPRPFALPLPDTATARGRTPQLYLELMKKVVMNTVYDPSPSTIDGSAYPAFTSRLTMIGTRRLDNTQQLLQVVISEHVPGDFIETGTWRGGSAMFAAAVLNVYQQLGAGATEGQPGRWVWLADSFSGIPAVRPKLYPADSQHMGAEMLSMDEHNSARQVLASFKELGLYEDRAAIRILQGYFNETLPEPRKQEVFAKRKFCLIRLDGDTYESTIQGLEALYPHLAVGGFVVVDDYMDWYGARMAVQDYRSAKKIRDPIAPVFHENVRFEEAQQGEIPRGVWWRKTEELQMS